MYLEYISDPEAPLMCLDTSQGRDLPSQTTITGISETYRVGAPSEETTHRVGAPPRVATTRGTDLLRYPGTSAGASVSLVCSRYIAYNIQNTIACPGASRGHPSAAQAKVKKTLHFCSCGTF